MTNYGNQIDAWGALIPGRASVEQPLRDKFIEKMEAKGLEGLAIERSQVAMSSTFGVAGAGEAREHVVLKQGLGRGAVATVAVRIAPKGKEDLELSWRLFERNVQTEIMWGLTSGALVFWGVIIALAGILTAGCLSMVGIYMIGAGLGWWGRKSKEATTSTYHQFDSRVLLQSVDHALMTALDELEVEPHELRILVQSQTPGMGNMRIPGTPIA